MDIGQKQSVESLRFFLFDRPLHPELFDIHDSRRIERRRYESRIWVTGCTHVVSFHRGEGTLCEVLADSSAMLPTRGETLSIPFRGEKGHQQKQLDGINYMMNFQLERVSPRVYRRTHHEFARAAGRGGLFVPYPMWMENSLTPYTYISYEPKDDNLHVMAFHGFPEALTLIKTQSIFELG